MYDSVSCLPSKERRSCKVSVQFFLSETHLQIHLTTWQQKAIVYILCNYHCFHTSGLAAFCFQNIKHVLFQRSPYSRHSISEVYLVPDFSSRELILFHRPTPERKSSYSRFPQEGTLPVPGSPNLEVTQFQTPQGVARSTVPDSPRKELAQFQAFPSYRHP